MKTFILVLNGLFVPLNIVMGVLTGDVKSYIAAAACAFAFGLTCTT